MADNDIARGSWEEYYFPDPGAVERAACGICYAEMTVVRDADGPTSWVMAMGQSRRKHDAFSCPHAKEDWHRQVKALLAAARMTPSNKLKKLYKDEAGEIVAANRPMTP